jgi:hypothetical protein
LRCKQKTQHSTARHSTAPAPIMWPQAQADARLLLAPAPCSCFPPRARLMSLDLHTHKHTDTHTHLVHPQQLQFLGVCSRHPAHTHTYTHV